MATYELAESVPPQPLAGGGGAKNGAGAASLIIRTEADLDSYGWGGLRVGVGVRGEGG